MDFTKPWDFGDVTFVVEGKKIYANKATLAMSSEVFSVMLTSEFAEKSMTRIKLPRKKFDAFLELMEMLHPPHSITIDETNMEQLFLLAHEYQIDHVIERCTLVLLNQPPSIKNLVLADRFSLPELRKVCIEHVKGVRYQDLTANDDLKKLNQDTLIEVFEHKLKAKDEIYDLLNYRVEPLEQFKARLHKLAHGSEMDTTQFCSNRSPHFATHLYGQIRTCGNCLNHIRAKLHNAVMQS